MVEQRRLAPPGRLARLTANVRTVHASDAMAGAGAALPVHHDLGQAAQRRATMAPNNPVRFVTAGENGGQRLARRAAGGW